jgi:hypothetical protein
MSIRNKSQQTADDIAMIAGIQKYLPTATFLVTGQSMPAAQVVATLQGRVDAATAAVSAMAAFHAAVQQSDALHASTDPVVAGVRQTVLAMYAGSPATLAAFHVNARKVPAPRSTEEKLVAAAKAKATRVARHTMSKKQKAAITGSLSEPIVVPVTAGAGSGSSTSSGAAPAAPATPSTDASGSNGSSAAAKA